MAAALKRRSPADPGRRDRRRVHRQARPLALAASAARRNDQANRRRRRGGGGARRAALRSRRSRRRRPPRRGDQGPPGGARPVPHQRRQCAATARKVRLRLRRRQSDPLRLFVPRRDDAAAGLRAGGRRHRISQLAARQRPRSPARAARARRQRQADAELRHGGDEGRAGRLDLYDQILERERGIRLRRLDRHGGDSRRRLDRRHRPARRFSHPFLRRRPPHSRSRLETIRAEPRFFDLRGQNRLHRRQRPASLRHRRDAPFPRRRRRRAARRDRRPDAHERQAVAARLGAGRGVPLHGGDFGAARRRPALSFDVRRRRDRRRIGVRLGGRQLVRLQPLWPAARSDHAFAGLGRRLFLRRARVVCAQAGRGARDPLRLRPLCLADRGRQARRRPDRAAGSAAKSGG